MRRLAQFFEESAGKFSMTRLVTFGWAFVPLCVWAVNSLRSGQLADIPLEVVGLIMTVVSVKTVQRHVEKQAAQGDSNQ